MLDPEYLKNYKDGVDTKHSRLNPLPLPCPTFFLFLSILDLRSWIGNTHDHSVYSRGRWDNIRNNPLDRQPPFVKTYNKRATVASFPRPVGSANIISLQTDLISHNSRAQ